MTNMLRFCNPSKKSTTLAALKLKVISAIEKQITRDIGNNESPAEALAYWTEMAFDCAIHIAYLSRQSPKDDNDFPDIKSHNENLAKYLTYDGYLSEYYWCYLALDEALRRINHINKKENIIQRWPNDKAIKFYGKGSNSNLSIALTFSEWIYHTCLTYTAEQMGMDNSLVIEPTPDKYALNFYELAMRNLLKELPDEIVWSKTKIQEEGECISSGIATERDIYTSANTAPQEKIPPLTSLTETDKLTEIIRKLDTVVPTIKVGGTPAKTEQQSKSQVRIEKKKPGKISDKNKKFQSWGNSGDACFIIEGNRIKFHYKMNDKDLAIKNESKVHKLLFLFAAKNPLPQNEIKDICSEQTRPSDIAKQTNKKLNEKIAAMKLPDVSKDIEFIKYDNKSKCYGLWPKIKHIDDVD